MSRDKPTGANYVLVVLARPGSAAITDIQLQLLANAGAPEPRWLAKGEALEVDGFQQAQAAVETMRDQGFDAAIVPVANRRKQILIADMDSTMIEQECIDELGAAIGIGDKISTITARAMRGEIDFEGALTERVGLLRGLSERVIDDVIKEKITFMPGGRTLLSTMKAHGAYCALVSGGFTAFTSHVAHSLGFDEHRANQLVIANGKLTGDVASPILGKDAKVESLDRICATRALSREVVLAVGDGANDIPMLQAAGMGVALHAKPKVQVQAHYVINHGDLTALLYLQGYKRDEFVFT